MENNTKIESAEQIKSAEGIMVNVDVKPTYAQLNAIGKTCGQAATGTIDRKVISRCILTDSVFDKDYRVVGGDDTKFVKVAAKDEVEVWVEMVGNIKSLASFKFYGVYVAANKENDGVTDIFVPADSDDQTKIERALDCASRMSGAHPECDGQYKFVDKDGNRVFLRSYAKVNAHGMIG